MKNPLDTIKPRVRELKAYTLSPDRASVKINQNENPWDAPEAIKQETMRRLSRRAWSRYPDFRPSSLHEKLAGFAGWRADGVVAGNGSNELIQATLMVTIGEGRRVLISEPTFALYRQVATVLGGEVLSVPLDGGLKFEAGRRVSRLRARRANLAVFRTFSKAMGMAALRGGYLLASPDLAREVSKAVLPYNLNAFSQTAAAVHVELYEQELKPSVRRIVAEREGLYEALRRVPGLAPVPSHANFMVVRTEVEPRRVFPELRRPPLPRRA